MQKTPRKTQSNIIFGVLILFFVMACNSCTSSPSGNNIPSPLPTTIVNPPSATAVQINTAIPTSTDIPTSTLTSSPTSTNILPTTVTPNASFTVLRNANIRSGPGTDFTIVDGVSSGEELLVYGKNETGTWLLIDNLNSYWISVIVGTLSDPIETIPIAPTTTPTSAPTSTHAPSRTPSPTFIPLLGHIYAGVDVYYGINKAYGFEILGGVNDCDYFPSGQGVLVLYPNGSREWKDRWYLVSSGIFFVREDDPAIDSLEWRIYPCP